MATWEFLLLTNTQGLVGGGRAGLFWSYIWTMCGFGLMIVSLAEMASMAPTCGAQYHWYALSESRILHLLTVCHLGCQSLLRVTCRGSSAMSLVSLPHRRLS